MVLFVQFGGPIFQFLRLQHSLDHWKPRKSRCCYSPWYFRNNFDLILVVFGSSVHNDSYGYSYSDYYCYGHRVMKLMPWMIARMITGMVILLKSPRYYQSSCCCHDCLHHSHQYHDHHHRRRRRHHHTRCYDYCYCWSNHNYTRIVQNRSVYIAHQILHYVPAWYLPPAPRRVIL